MPNTKRRVVKPSPAVAESRHAGAASTPAAPSDAPSRATEAAVQAALDKVETAHAEAQVVDKKLLDQLARMTEWLDSRQKKLTGQTAKPDTEVQGAFGAADISEEVRDRLARDISFCTVFDYVKQMSGYLAPGSVVLVENHLRAECHWKGVILAETWDQGRGRIPMFPGR
ncbi:MAG: hypothetical protein JWO38_632, partial [Gemmataceae bacterium]|nr:hypothetical protein [Gemmataceae bacterium]